VLAYVRKNGPPVTGRLVQQLSVPVPQVVNPAPPGAQLAGPDGPESAPPSPPPPLEEEDVVPPEDEDAVPPLEDALPLADALPLEVVVLVPPSAVASFPPSEVCGPLFDSLPTHPATTPTPQRARTANERKKVFKAILPAAKGVTRRRARRLPEKDGHRQASDAAVTASQSRGARAGFLRTRSAVSP
jgi:hypothetical protein